MKAPARAGRDPRIVLIVQARMGSTRLPGKSMMDLAGAPLLGRILERVKRATRPHAVAMATTEKPEDDILLDVAARYDVAAFRGSENDLVDRHYRCARAFAADLVVRIPADNAVPEPQEIDRIIAHHLTSPAVFSSNLSPMLGNDYPDGIGAEVMDFWALEEVWRGPTDPRTREHPHLNFFDYATGRATDPTRYPVGTVPCPRAFARPDLVLDINTRAQYDLIRALYHDLYPKNALFHITDVIAWYDGAYREGTAAQTKTYCIDIDGTLCTITDGAYSLAQPLTDVVAEINRLYDQGHRIILLTARGSGSGIDWRAVTERQLADWHVKYHELHFGKPPADIYIDDKTINAIAWRTSGFTRSLPSAAEERVV